MCLVVLAVMKCPSGMVAASHDVHMVTSSREEQLNNNEWSVTNQL